MNKRKENVKQMEREMKENENTREKTITETKRIGCLQAKKNSKGFDKDFTCINGLSVNIFLCCVKASGP